MVVTRGRLTRADVAREARVSETTVSYVLSGGKHAEEISDETKQRVLSAARRLGYRRVSIGSALQRGYSDTIVLLFHGQDFPGWHARTTIAVSRAAASRQLSVNTQFAEDDKSVLSFVESIPSISPYGLLLLWESAALATSGLLDLQSEGLPVVDLMPSELSEIVSVTADREQGFRLLTEHLVHLGHRKIAIIVDRLSEFTSSKSKLAGYRRSLEAADIEFDESLVEQASWSGFEDGYQGFKRLRSRRPDATAVLCIDDRSALGVLAAAQDSGVRVPAELSVAGWGADPESAYFRPRLTTVAAPATEIARNAVELLVKMRETGGFMAESIYAQMELIVRESTGPAPGQLPSRGRPNV